MGKRESVIVLLFVLLLPGCVLRETVGDRPFWDQRLFQPILPPEPLLDDVLWVRDNYADRPKILMVRGEWPNGPYVSFLEWAMYMLDIDQVMSFMYVGTIHDLMAGNPSKGMTRPNPLPSNPHPVIPDWENYLVLVFANGNFTSLYDPDALERKVLVELRPGVYSLDSSVKSRYRSWMNLWESVVEGRIPGGDVAYLESSFAGWTARSGELSALANGAEFVMWQNTTWAWLRTDRLHIQNVSTSCMLLRANVSLGVAVYVDFYGANNRFLGRLSEDARSSGIQTFALDMKPLNLGPSDYISGTAISFRSSLGGQRVFRIYWIVILVISF